MRRQTPPAAPGTHLFGQFRRVAKRSLFVTALLPAVLALSTTSVWAHRLVLLPIDQGAGEQTLLPIVTGEPHLTPLDPTPIGFGELLVGSTDSRSFQIRNDSGETLTVTLGVAAPFSIAAEDAAFDLAPGATRVIDVSVTGVTPGDFTMPVVATSKHPGAPALDEELASLTVSVRLPPPGISLSLPDFGLSDISSFDFGLISGERHDPTSLDVPTFRLRITHTGTPGVHTAITGLDIVGGFGIPSLSIGYCFPLTPVDTCIGDENGDADGDGGRFENETLAPGASIDAIVRLYPFADGWVDQDFTISASNLQNRTLTLTGGVVPAGMSQGPFVGREGTGTGGITKTGETGYEGFGRSTDPLGPDTIGGFVPAGYDPRALFALGDVDDVDARTGNVVVPIPLGGRQVVQGDLGWELTLVVNGRIWRRETNWGYPLGISLPEPDTRPGQHILSQLEAMPAYYPNPAYNVTAGVSLHLGRLIPPLNGNTDSVYDLDPSDSSILDYEKTVNTGPRWVYIDPTGTEHPFFNAMHGAEPTRPSYNDSTIMYTRDGSFLRLHRQTLQSGATSVQAAWVEHPNGQRHLFLRQSDSQLQPTLPDRWLLHRIEDRSGNAVVIDYDKTARTWTIEGATVSRGAANQLGTVTKLGWRKTTVQFDTAGRPTSVTHRGFGGGASPAREFSFSYSATRTVERPIQSYFHTILRSHYGIDTKAHFSTLEGITQPDDTQWGFRWELEDRNADGTKDDISLAGLDLPTGGAIDYTWGVVRDVVHDCGNKGRNQPLWGVQRRTAKGVGGGTLADQIYLRQFRSANDVTGTVCDLFANDQSNHPPRPELRVAVWTDQRHGPNKGKSSLDINYFSVYPFASSSTAYRGWTNVERNLNVTRKVPDPSTAGGSRYLSRELYQCDVDLPSWTTADTPTVGFDDDAIGNDSVGDRIEDLENLPACHKLESTYSRFEVARQDICSQFATDCLYDSRLVSRRVVHHTDGNKWVRTERSDHDGVGHYRRTETYSNFQGAGTSALQVQYQDYNPCDTTPCDGTRTLMQDPVDHKVIGTYTPPSNWVLFDTGTFWFQSGGLKRGGERVFDDAGLLRLERTWRLGGTGTRDLVVKYAYQNGALTLERHFGADTYSCAQNGDLPTVDWKVYAPAQGETDPWTSACQDYAIQYQYQNGMLSLKQVTQQTVHELKRTIDASTGWTLTEIANSGEVTTLGYDKMGRVTSVTRKHAANFNLAYSAPNASRGWQATIKGYPQGGSPTSPTYRFVAIFDGLGRLVSEDIPAYDGTRVIRSRQYHVGGKLRWFTSLTDVNRKTTFEYDALGRLTDRVNFDGEGFTIVYRGDREVQVTGSVSTWSSGTQLRQDQDAVTVVHYDALGRVVQVDAPEGAVTRWTYDPLGQVETATRGTQTKRYGVDGRGFTTFEALPEKLRWIGTGTEQTPEQIATQFTSFDTRGNGKTAYERVRNDNGTFGTVYRTTNRAFDPLGRVTAITVVGDSSKTFIYDTSSGCTHDAAAAGKLVHATRTNLLGVEGIWRVHSDFCYDAAGRVEQRDTRVTSQFVGGTESGPKFRQTWTYDDFGNVTAETYPVVIPLEGQTQAQCGACGRTSARTVNRSYAQGFYLTSVSDPGSSALGASFTYHDNGLPDLVTHNGTSGNDQYFRDLTGMPRWSRMRLAGGLLDFNPVTYDGSGNIKTIGGNQYYYDRNGRLSRAALTCIGCTYDYNYDQYDNNTSSGTTDTLNNQLRGGPVTYDVFGNFKEGQEGKTFSYDGFDKLTAIGTSTGQTLAVYDHDDLRVLFRSLTEPLNKPSYTFRDSQGRVIREVRGLGDKMEWQKDYIYGAGRLLSSQDRQGVIRHYHTDQLGTARVVTENGTSGGTELHYEPYGRALMGAPSGERAVGFAGHEEQDMADVTYMRGRSYLHQFGKFMQVDPARTDWNGYAYANNNPVSVQDSSGLCAENDSGTEECEEEDKELTEDQKKFLMETQKKIETGETKLDPINLREEAEKRTPPPNRETTIGPYTVEDRFNDIEYQRRQQAKREMEIFIQTGLLPPEQEGGSESFYAAKLRELLDNLGKIGQSDTFRRHLEEGVGGRESRAARGRNAPYSAPPPPLPPEIERERLLRRAIEQELQLRMLREFRLR